MVDIPYIAYLLSDFVTLLEYTEHKFVPVSEIRRRLIASARNFNPYLPDYVYEKKYAMVDANFVDTTNLGKFLVSAFHALAKRYLFMQDDRLYVRKEKLEEWMEVQKLCPPLLICAAFYIGHLKPSKSANQSFFHNVLVPQFSTSAMRIPYVFELENTIKNGKLLSDLHVHLNGTTETDMLWWTQIGRVDKWINSFKGAVSKESVRQQYEDINIFSINKLAEHLRQTKKIMDTLAERINVCYPLFDRSWQFYFPYNHYPSLAKGAYFYLALFELMNKNDDVIARPFHFLTLVLGEVHRLLVQQRNQKGFARFGVIPNNDLRWKYESKDYLSRFKQLIVDNDFCFLKHLEGRFSPKNRTVENLDLIHHISNEYKYFCDTFQPYLLNNRNVCPWHDYHAEIPNKLTLVAHFIKQKDDETRHMYERHLKLRKTISLQSHALLSTVRHQKIGDVKIKGIDAASDEMTAGPEVFSPAFRFMRNHWPEHEHLKITFHAGEDFVHLLSGLRMMFEAALFLDLQQGDRIGHGTAAGIDPALWMERIGGEVSIAKGEWMDDLIVVYYLILDERNPYPSLRSLLPILRTEIENRVVDIYHQNVAIPILIDSWKCRKYEPGYYLLNRTSTVMDSQEEKEHCYSLLKDDFVREIFFKYQLDKPTKDRYNQLETVKIAHGLFSVDDLVHLQDLVLDRLARKNIALEVPISSNLSISFYKELGEHHLGRWLKGHSADGKLLIPAVVIGSDDPGIFMTNIYIEYARIMEYLEQKGYNITERLQKITELNRLANDYSF